MSRPGSRPWIPWFLLSAAALAVLAARLSRKAPPPPPTADGALGRLRALGLRVVPESSAGGPEGGCWLVERGQDVSRRRLSLLVRQRRRVGDWRGVVLMTVEPRAGAPFPSDPVAWDRTMLYVRPLSFFGDPELVGRIRGALLDQPEAPPADSPPGNGGAIAERRGAG